MVTPDMYGLDLFMDIISTFDVIRTLNQYRTKKFYLDCDSESTEPNPHTIPTDFFVEFFLDQNLIYLVVLIRVPDWIKRCYDIVIYFDALPNESHFEIHLQKFYIYINIFHP